MDGQHAIEPGRRQRLHEIIFEADTPAGKAFDVSLLIAIIISVVAVCLESVDEINDRFGPALRITEWVLTFAFTIEYALRLICVRKPWKYALSFYGVIDLLAILPTYLSIFIGGAQSLLVIRALRLLRIFRVFKLAHFLNEASDLRNALKASVRKIIIFIGYVFVMILILGTMMYLIEGPESGFTSIPQSVYWAIVTMTTVGYGDIAPVTVPGKVLASFAMLTGYAIIAVPTGIVTAEMTHFNRRTVSTQVCPSCSREGHTADAKFCKYCGASM